MPVNNTWVLPEILKRGKNIGNVCQQCIGYTGGRSTCGVVVHWLHKLGIKKYLQNK